MADKRHHGVGLQHPLSTDTQMFFYCSRHLGLKYLLRRGFVCGTACSIYDGCMLPVRLIALACFLCRAERLLCPCPPLSLWGGIVCCDLLGEPLQDSHLPGYVCCSRMRGICALVEHCPAW